VAAIAPAGTARPRGPIPGSETALAATTGCVEPVTDAGRVVDGGVVVASGAVVVGASVVVVGAVVVVLGTVVVVVVLVVVLVVVGAVLDVEVVAGATVAPPLVAVTSAINSPTT
jgi:hypothetical protein